jgi:SAM-dependent methyltransferase
MDDSMSINRANWDERAPAHAASPDYQLPQFIENPRHLSHVVAFDVPRLGDLAGLRGVHLQCHIGTDTISLSRLGARMTGLDFSPASIAEARALANRIEADVDFVQADVYDAISALGGEQFDLVFTGIGALCWLPDVRRWASVVAGLLNPGGRLFLREGHPMLWALADTVSPDDKLVVDYPYFETAEPVVFDEGGTYVATDATFSTTITHSWNHGLGEIITALHSAGLQLTMFEEHDTVPWNALPGLMAKADDGEWRLVDRPERLAASYTLQAVKLVGRQ